MPKKNLIFIPCELKPNSYYFKYIKHNVISYKPAFVFGKLLEVKSAPFSEYLISEIGYIDNNPILFGYLCDITNEGLIVADKMKGFMGDTDLNSNHRRLDHCFLNFNLAVSCWIYHFRKQVNNVSYKEVKFGLWDLKDLELMNFVKEMTN
jgi:hypothetical protein